MANDTTSTLDSCKSVQGLMVARCKQFNDLLDDIMHTVSYQTNRPEPANGIDDFVYAVSHLADLIERGIEMANNWDYYKNVNDR